MHDIHAVSEVFAASFGLAVLLPRAKPWLWLLQRAPKILLELGSCSLCIGFWIGLVLGFYNGLDGVTLGAVTSVTSYGFGLVLDILSELLTGLRIKNSERL